MIIFVIFIVVLIVIFIFIMPLLFSFTIVKLDDYRNYVNIISSILSGLIGSIGVILGYFYYKDKQRKDDLKEQRTKRSITIDRFLKVFDDCDILMERLFHKQIKNDEELKVILDQIQKNSEFIMIFMEKNEQLIGFSDEEMSPVRDWYSIIGSSSFVKIKKKQQITNKLIAEHQEK